MKLHYRLLLALAPLFALPTAAFSQASAVPSLISYQGTVFQADGVTPVGQGTPVNRSVVFRIWNHQSNSALADLIYSETQVVTIADGQFSVLVGEGVATTVGNYGNETSKKLADLSTAFSSGDRYLGVTVAAGAALLASDNEISPRQRIVSTGFALRAKLAESLAGGNDFILNPTTVPAGSLASNYGVGWYGTGRLFGTTAVDGPVLFGNSGGALGSSNGSGGTKSLSLLWNSSGQVGIGATGNFAGTNKLTLQGDDAASPASQLSIRGNSDNNRRVLLGFNTTANNATLQSYSAAAATGNLLLNPAGGNVGVGKIPAVALDVNGAISASGNIATTAGIQVSQLLSFPSGSTVAPANGATGGAGSRIVLWPGDITSAPYAFGMNGGTLWSGVPSNAAFRWYHGTTERMSLSSAGLAIGKTNATHVIDVMGRIRLDSSSVGEAGLWLAESGTNKAFIGLYDADHVGFYGEGGAGWGMVMNRNNANVGIGDITPTEGKLVVRGTASANPGSYFRFAWNSFGTPIGSFASTVTPTIYSSGDIFAGGTFVAGSDLRIKNRIGRSDGEQDLRTLEAIEITDYTMRDVVAKGTDKQKKVIAQQVESVYPQAVSKTTDVIPDIYQKAPVKGGWVKLATDLRKGDRVRIISQDQEGIYEVLEVGNDGFRTELNSSSQEVFVYGREVSDFRSVDYDAISMLNVSATQQLKRDFDSSVNELQKENSELRKRVAALEAKDKARDAKMASIEKLLGTTEQPVTRTISIQSK